MGARATAIYDQSTGEFSIISPVDDGGIVRVDTTFHGYAGRGIGRNNPNAEDQRNLGPLPRGHYALTGPFTHRKMGPLAFRLWPFPLNVMFGRSGFLIHGDNETGTASSGCIILGRTARAAIAEKGVRWLHVT